jgi:hypothetical protein
LARGRSKKKDAPCDDGPEKVIIGTVATAVGAIAAVALLGLGAKAVIKSLPWT